MDKKTMTAEQVEAFVEANKYAVDLNTISSRCVDGRYKQSSDLSPVAKPGADAGTLMTAFGALNDLQVHPDMAEVLGVVKELIGGDSRFNFHTDSHAEHDHLAPGMGCGHLKQAKNDPDAYSVTQEQIDFIFSVLPNIIQGGGQQVVLDGSHGEQAVLVVESESHSVAPQADDGTQVFVYQKTFDERLLERLAEVLYEKYSSQYPALSREAMHEAVVNVSTVQLHETLKRLANGLPIYVAAIDPEGLVKIEQ
jgi:hypothetical protein